MTKPRSIDISRSLANGEQTMFYFFDVPRCDACGRFHKCEAGSSGVMLYSGFPLIPDRGITRCRRCTESRGPLQAQPGIKSNQAWIVPARPAERKGIEGAE